MDSAQCEDKHQAEKPGLHEGVGQPLQGRPVHSFSLPVYRPNRAPKAPLNLKPRKTAALKLYRSSSLSTKSCQGHTQIGHNARQQLDRQNSLRRNSFNNQGAEFSLEHPGSERRVLSPGDTLPAASYHGGHPAAAACSNGAHASSTALQVSLQHDAARSFGCSTGPADYGSPGNFQQINLHQFILPPGASCKQQQQQQTEDRPNISLLARPLQPAALSLMATFAGTLLCLAAEHASLAAAAELEQQLLQQLRLDAAEAAAVGQRFDVAAAIEQLLPDLQEAVLHECREAQQQRPVVATAAQATVAAAPPAAAALNTFKQQQQPYQQQHCPSLAAADAACNALLRSKQAAPSYGGVHRAQPCSSSEAAAASAATAAAAAVVAAAVRGGSISNSAAMLARTVAELQDVTAAAAAAADDDDDDVPGHQGSTTAALRLAAAGAAEPVKVHSEALKAALCEHHNEQCKALSSSSIQHWVQPQVEKAGSSASDTSCCGWGINTPPPAAAAATADALPRQAVAGGGEANAGGGAAAAAAGAPSDIPQLQLLLQAVEMLQQQ